MRPRRFSDETSSCVMPKLATKRSDLSRAKYKCIIMLISRVVVE